MFDRRLIRSASKKTKRNKRHKGLCVVENHDHPVLKEYRKFQEYLLKYLYVKCKKKRKSVSPLFRIISLQIPSEATGI